MSERRFVEIAPGVTQIRKDLRAKVSLKRPYEGVQTDSTDDHEGAHLVSLVARGRWAKKASRIPGPGYLGYVEGDVDSESAMAADAMGFGGTGHDKRLAAILGDPDAGASNARRTVNENYEEWKALSRAIHSEQEISGYYAEYVFEAAQNPFANIEIESSSGKKWNFITKVRKVKGHLVLLGIQEEESKEGIYDKRDNVYDIKTKIPLTEKANPIISITS